MLFRPVDISQKYYEIWSANSISPPVFSLEKTNIIVFDIDYLKM